MSSFSANVKEELTTVRLRRAEDAKALLSGFTLAIASLKYVPSAHGWGVRYVSESVSAIDFAAKLIKQHYGLDMELSVTEHERLRARNNELAVFGAGIDDFMTEMGLASLNSDNERVFEPRVPSFVESEHTQKAFVRGVFLACGSVSDPQKGCHAEMVCKSSILSQAVIHLLLPYNVRMKSSIRKNSFVVYAKEGETVEDLLAYIGAGAAVLAVGEARMMREIANESNRGVNCITANIEKAARTSIRRIDDIRTIYRTIGRDALPQQLAQTAEARVNNPEMTLSELADLLGIGRSAASYRLSKLSRIAEDIKNEQSRTALGSVDTKDS